MKKREASPALLVLTAGLVIARAFGWITCSWWLVTVLLWLPVALLLLFILFIGAMFLVVILQELIKRWRERRHTPIT